MSEKEEQPKSGMSLTKRALGFDVNWTNSMVVFLPIVASIYGLCTTQADTKTWMFMFFWYYCTGIGITAGYHRLWAHRAYRACEPLQWVLALLGAGTYQGSAKWWCRLHRIHHRYIDTPQDPYDATRGFWYTHWGWMCMNEDKSLGRADVGDLRSNKVLDTQHTYYLPFAFTSGILIPWLVCALGWGDWRGGFFIAGMLRIVLVHNSTFFVNSLAHHPFMASQPFSDQNTSHDSLFTALLTLGEGYHNYHHEFPNDYRNGAKSLDYDPTKWTIRLFAFMGLASGLVRAPHNETKRQHNQMAKKKIEQEMKDIKVGPDPSILPLWSWDEIHAKTSRGEKMLVVEGCVIDLKKDLSVGAGLTHDDETIHWYDRHPGGKQLLDAFLGKDATEAFHGQVYRHSQAGLNMLDRLRVARLDASSPRSSPKSSPKRTKSFEE